MKKTFLLIALISMPAFASPGHLTETINFEGTLIPSSGDPVAVAFQADVYKSAATNSYYDTYLIIRAEWDNEPKTVEEGVTYQVTTTKCTSLELSCKTGESCPDLSCDKAKENLISFFKFKKATLPCNNGEYRLNLSSMKLEEFSPTKVKIQLY
ncbi:MAG: hypothetical protein WCQ53_04555 [bacterium]